MDKRAAKERFVKRLYSELQDFKQSVLSKDKESVYGEAYKVEIFSTLYEIFLEKADSISDAMLLNLLAISGGILETAYQDWLKKEDSSYRELKEHVDQEFEDMRFWMGEEA